MPNLERRRTADTRVLTLILILLLGSPLSTACESLETAPAGARLALFVVSREAADPGERTLIGAQLAQVEHESLRDQVLCVRIVSDTGSLRAATEPAALADATVEGSMGSGAAHAPLSRYAPRRAYFVHERSAGAGDHLTAVLREGEDCSSPTGIPLASAALTLELDPTETPPTVTGTADEPDTGAPTDAAPATPDGG